MDKNTSLQIKTTNQEGNATTTTIAYVNPNATNENLRLLAMKLNALTNNTYDSTIKVTKEVLL